MASFKDLSKESMADWIQFVGINLSSKLVGDGDGDGIDGDIIRC